MDFRDGIHRLVLAVPRLPRRLVELVNSLCTFFRMLPRSLQFGVCKVMKLETFVRNEVVFTAGDLADKFYIVASGRVEICVNDISDLRSGKLHSAAVLQRGDSFGEVALMVTAPGSCNRLQKAVAHGGNRPCLKESLAPMCRQGLHLWHRICSPARWRQQLHARLEHTFTEG